MTLSTLVHRGFPVGARGLFMMITCWLCITVSSQAQFSFERVPLNQIITTIQAESDFYFLYRKSLTTGIRLSFEADDRQLFPTLRDKLHDHGLDLAVDSARHQAIIYRRARRTKRVHASRVEVSGQVVDAESDDRLPYATIVWKGRGKRSGVSTNQSGVFQLSVRVPDSATTLTLTGSYVGYESKTIRLDIQEKKQWEDVTFRLSPQEMIGGEVVITGIPNFGDLDTTLHSLTHIGTFNPLGASNTMRALQVLPSVSFSTAMSDGVHVRGSDTDGFRVLLDGMTIYNQSHLFGLLDSFNADVLKRNAFYYDVAPARYQATPGGTLSLLTRTGSLNNFSGSVGLNNTSGRLTLEGPLKKGKSSFLISGRHSYMNAINWFDNASLVEWGLNVDRPRQVLEEGLVNIESRLVRPRDADASFFDLHGKLYFEGTSGNRLIISGYYGGDDTRQQADRLYRSFSSAEGVAVETRRVTSRNNWSNATGSVRYQWRLSDDAYAYSTVGASIYRSHFLKQDFTYTRISSADQSLRLFTYPFENESILNEVNADQRFDLNLGEARLSAGLSYHYYLGEYFEDSFDRPGFFTTRRAHRFDAYAQADYSASRLLDVQVGARTHYYSKDKQLYLSPRLKIRLFPESPVTLGGGYSRNFQFLNQVSLNNTVTADVWVLNGRRQSPTSADNYTVHLSYRPFESTYIQVEGYLKKLRNVRLHELNTYSLGGSFNELPWLVNNDGTSRGLELMLRNRFSFLTLTQTFTWSRTNLENPQINDGEPFFVDWDRTYQYNAMLMARPWKPLTLYLSWMYASGTPNRLAIFGPGNQQRLGHYRRADASVRYEHSFTSGDLQITVSLFNIFDRENPWYRDLAFVIDRRNNQTRFRKVPVDVYGLGFRPSFNVSYSF